VRGRRRERDSLGATDVPARALWGAFTERARATFDLTGRRPHPALTRPAFQAGVGLGVEF